MDKRSKRVSQGPIDVDNWLAEVEIEFGEISDEIGNITLIFPIERDTALRVQKNGRFNLLIETSPPSHPRRKLPPSPGPPPNRPLPPLPNSALQTPLSLPLSPKGSPTNKENSSAVVVPINSKASKGKKKGKVAKYSNRRGAEMMLIIV